MVKKTFIFSSLQDARYEKQLMSFVKERYPELAIMEGGSLSRATQAAQQYRSRTDPKEQGVLLLLIDRALSEAELLLYQRSFDEIILVSEAEGIDPYQSAVRVLSEVLEQGERFEGKVIGIYSPFGGIGKHTLGMILARILQEKGKVLFLSFQPLFPYELYFGGSGTAADRDSGKARAGLKALMYSYLTEPEPLFRSRVVNLPKKCGEGFFCLPPDMGLKDWEALEPGDPETILQSLSLFYSHIILVFPALLNEGMGSFLSACTRRMLIMENMEEGRIKLKRALPEGMSQGSFDYLIQRETGAKSSIRRSASLNTAGNARLTARLNAAGNGNGIIKGDAREVANARETVEILLPFEQKIYEWKGGERVFLPQGALFKAMRELAATVKG